ncbi:MAG: Holliday junction branch migration protein RuvA [Cyclobacteriaceae bacterium]|nr:Holliday junction branch migration protein RuvA [Cyclobacteriaceae bacterium]
MIGFLKGALFFKDPTYVIIEVHGVGYEVKISLSTYSKIKELDDCLLYTHLHVKEDAHTLYGFFGKEEKSTFLQLISISGVGPNTALMINSSLSPEELKKAIIHEEVDTIQRVKGIGNKTAHRIILELKDKIKKEGLENMGAATGSNKVRNEALAALVTLGINRNIAEKSVDAILKRHGEDVTLEELIKLVLKQA